jgi:hypothetical protein
VAEQRLNEKTPPCFEFSLWLSRARQAQCKVAQQRRFLTLTSSAMITVAKKRRYTWIACTKQHRVFVFGVFASRVFVPSLSWQTIGFQKRLARKQNGAGLFRTSTAISSRARERKTPANTGIFEPFIYTNDHFAKTGSG